MGVWAVSRQSWCSLQLPLTFCSCQLSRAGAGLQQWLQQWPPPWLHGRWAAGGR